MTQIDASSALAAAIRRQVSSLARPGQTAGVAPHSGQTAGQAPSGARSSGAPADLATIVARRVRAIDPDDPGRRRKAFRVFLESVLLAELGEARLINDPGFYRLVDEVQLQMEGDAGLSRSIDEAAVWLLDGSPPRASSTRSARQGRR